MNKNLKKVSSAATAPCRFRGTGIECPLSQYLDHVCDTCGWNPDVEEKRLEEMGYGKRRNKRL